MSCTSSSLVSRCSRSLMLQLHPGHRLQHAGDDRKALLAPPLRLRPLEQVGSERAERCRGGEGARHPPGKSLVVADYVEGPARREAAVEYAAWNVGEGAALPGANRHDL